MLNSVSGINGFGQGRGASKTEGFTDTVSEEMAVIVCPNCQTRYETAATIPPEGRKVRCSKCGHVWQAVAVFEAARPPMAPAAPLQRPPAAPTAPRAPAGPAAPGMGPRPQPMRAPAPQAVPRPNPAASPANAGAMGGFGGMQSRQPNGGGQTVSPPFGASGDASFDTPDDFQADMPGGEGSMPPMGGQDWSQDLGSYNAGALVEDEVGQTNVPIAGKGKKRKVPPTVAIGWGALVLLLALIGALFALAPKTVVSILPGANKLYAMMGSPVNLTGLNIQDVRYAWEDGGEGPVLKVEGQVVNVSGSEIAVPPVIVALQDKDGAEVTAVTTEVGLLAPGASAPFVAEIPSPQAPVSNLQVRFAEAS